MRIGIIIGYLYSQYVMGGVNWRYNIRNNKGLLKVHKGVVKSVLEYAIPQLYLYPILKGIYRLFVFLDYKSTYILHLC
jgi:hypothetical protein